jgi:polar amino acid transport system substrate-binding protein
MNLQRLVTSLAALLLLAAPAWADLKVGVDTGPYPPFAAPDPSGKWKGWEIDFLDALCAELREKCEIVPTAWSELTAALDARDIDLIVASMTVTDDRRAKMAFSRKYYEIPTVIVGAQDGDMDVTPDHLSGKVIGVQVLTAYQSHAVKYYAAAGARVRVYQTLDEANDDLVAAHIDYVEADAASIANFLKTERGKTCCEMKGRVIPDTSILGDGVAVGLRKDDAALLKRVDDAIAALAASGKLKQITEGYPDLKPVIVTP